jgi:hypothetical protein
MQSIDEIETLSEKSLLTGKGSSASKVEIESPVGIGSLLGRQGKGRMITARTREVRDF